jgi:hypothetical protein
MGGNLCENRVDTACRKRAFSVVATLGVFAERSLASVA